MVFATHFASLQHCLCLEFFYFYFIINFLPSKSLLTSLQGTKHWEPRSWVSFSGFANYSHEEFLFTAKCGHDSAASYHLLVSILY